LERQQLHWTRGHHGHINLAILKSSAHGTSETPRDMPGYAGIDHLGFLVEDVEETCNKLEAECARKMIDRVNLQHAPTTGPRSYYEIKYRGPDGQVIDVTETGWAGTWPERTVRGCIGSSRSLALSRTASLLRTPLP
jgi:hypothetical protein